jgi:hypothetical protein
MGIGVSVEEGFARDRVREILDRMVEVVKREFGISMGREDVAEAVEQRKMELYRERVKEAMGHLSAEDIMRAEFMYENKSRKKENLETLPEMKVGRGVGQQIVRRK